MTGLNDELFRSQKLFITASQTRNEKAIETSNRISYQIAVAGETHNKALFGWKSIERNHSAATL